MLSHFSLRRDAGINEHLHTVNLASVVELCAVAAVEALLPDGCVAWTRRGSGC